MPTHLRVMARFCLMHLENQARQVGKDLEFPASTKVKMFAWQSGLRGNMEKLSKKLSTTSHCHADDLARKKQQVLEHAHATSPQTTYHAASFLCNLEFFINSSTKAPTAVIYQRLAAPSLCYLK
nr:hypothetical protein Iba_chr13bCG8620 [Ipomoea batatas]